MTGVVEILPISVFGKTFDASVYDYTAHKQSCMQHKIVGHANLQKNRCYINVTCIKRALFCTRGKNHRKNKGGSTVEADDPQVVVDY